MNGKDVNQVIESSPLRNGSIVVLAQHRAILNDIQKNIFDSISDPRAKLKIAILGEVKAGKSLLANAIVGREVSRVDVLEATNSIIEIQFGIAESFSGQRQPHPSKHTVIYCESPHLKNLTLIDTPGLLTITEENAAVTEDFKASADIFLWVFNAHHAGQTDISDAISKLGDLGKRIIGVINRVDELDAPPEEIDEVREYFEQDLYGVDKPMFPISAKLAWDTAKNGDELPEDSGIPALLRYIDGLIDEDEHNLKQKSIREALKKLIALDRYEHEQAKSELREKLAVAQKYRTRVDDYRRRTRDVIQRKVSDLLDKTAQTIAEQDGDRSENAELEINKRGKILSNEIADMWRKMAETLPEEVAKEYSSDRNTQTPHAHVDKTINTTAGAVPIASTGASSMEGAMSGGTTGAIAGGVLAVGEVIAGATLASAIATVFFPVAIVGAIAGYFASKRRKSDHSQLGVSNASLVRELKDILHEKLHETLTGNFTKMSDENCNQLLEAIDQYCPQNLIDKQISTIDDYLAESSLIPAEYDIDTDERVALSTRRQERRNAYNAVMESLSDDDDFGEEVADV